MPDDAGVRVVGLWRYPVKSMAGESLTHAHVGELGIDGDRQWGLVDTATGLVLTARRVPALLHAHPVSDGDGMAIRLPDGTVTDDDGVLSRWLEREVVLARASADAGGTYEIAMVPDGSAYDLHDRSDAQWTQWDGPPGVFHDSGRTRVSIVSTGSLGAWDVRRFRPNVVVSGSGESDLVGHRVRVGEGVELDVVKPISRCIVTTRPQPGVAADLEVLRSVQRDRAGNLGVGALVVGAGLITVGDLLEVEVQHSADG